jgi:ubiquinone/menaquinone biosynthesis C-methylase UbiE
MSRRYRKKVFESREGYDLYAPHYRKDHNHLDSFDWPLCRSIFQSLIEGKDPGSLAVLDLGCGDGRTFGRLSKILPGITGIDLSARMLDLLRAKDPGARLVQADCLALPFRPASFDLCLSFFLIVHVTDLDPFFREISRVLKPGGSLLLNNIPQHSPPVLEGQGEKFIIRSHYHSDREVLGAAEENGLELTARETSVQKGADVSTVFAWKK